MAAIVIIHALMILLGVGIIIRLVPEESVANALSYLHKTIGISTPPKAQTRAIALVWIGSALIIADGCLLLLVLVASSLH